MVPTQGGSVLFVCTKFEADSIFRSKVIKGSQILCCHRPFPGEQDGQNLISWRWSLPFPTNPVWWRSMHAISSYGGDIPTNTQTGPITIYCAAKLSTQCNVLLRLKSVMEFVRCPCNSLLSQRPLNLCIYNNNNNNNNNNNSSWATIRLLNTLQYSSFVYFIK